jgi:hypothetical protein
MKPIEDKLNANAFIQNLPLVEPMLYGSSHMATLADQSKMVVLNGNGVNLILPETLDKDCSF